MGVFQTLFPPDAPWTAAIVQQDKGTLNPGRADIQGELCKEANISNVYENSVGQSPLVHAP